jgi:hypothetical protein
MLGLIAFVAIGTLLFVHASLLILRGDAGGAARLVATRSAQEEIEDEIRDLEARSAMDVERGRPS